MVGSSPILADGAVAQLGREKSPSSLLSVTVGSRGSSFEGAASEDIVSGSTSDLISSSKEAAENEVCG